MGFALRTAAKILAGLLLVLVLAAAGFVWASWAPDRPVAELAARWAPPPSVFVEIAGMQVHLRDQGPRDDASPIVLVHGTGSSLHAFEGWAQALAKKRRVVTFDLPGFGLTGPAPDGDYAMAAAVRFVVAVLDRLGIARCVLGGNSLGGAISWATAVTAPERVEKLILVDAGGYPAHSISVPIGFRLARMPVLSSMLTNILPRGLVAQGLRDVFGDPSRVTPELIERYYELTLRAGNRRALVQRFSQPRSGELGRRIPEIKVPTLVMWGGRDRLIPPDDAERFHRDIAGSTLVIFDDLGHAPEEEDPARTVVAVERFLGLVP
jgi:pimeloyl-ACP methyl ester carboxylesterase